MGNELSVPVYGIARIRWKSDRKHTGNEYDDDDDDDDENDVDDDENDEEGDYNDDDDDGGGDHDVCTYVHIDRGLFDA